MDPGKGSINVKKDFCDRQKQLDEQLCRIEKSLNKHNNHEGSRVPKLEELSISSRKRNKIKGFRGRQSIFKRPEGPAPRSNIRTIPDYRRNPTKWTCYSLDDVPEMTNESNSQAAFAFLDELKKRKRIEQKQNKIKDNLKRHKAAMETDAEEGTTEDIDMDTEERFDVGDANKGAISFRKPQKKMELDTEKPKSEYRGVKVVMPEYEFGTRKVPKKKNTQKNKSEKVDKNKGMKLDHLEINDDEEE